MNFRAEKKQIANCVLICFTTPNGDSFLCVPDVAYGLTAVAAISTITDTAGIF